jgi:NADH-quinone oxidoreductase subunit N
LRGGGEWYTLNLLALLGTLVICSGSNLLVLYLGLELLTLSSYALVALRRDDPIAVEAAMKYFVLGSMASGFLLYGLSMVYGATGTLDITAVADAVASGQIKPQVLVFGLVFVVAGVAFKFGAAPFHMWLPDVYHGAPTAVTLVIGAAPKLAAFALAIRLLVEGLLPLALDWQPMLWLLAVVSLLVGNLAAIAQTNLKRMLAYSTIAQMGFVLMGLLAGVVGSNTLPASNAYGAAMFYVVTYVLSTLVSFGVIVLLSREGHESDEIADFAGLNRRHPWYAAVMALCMFSLAGIPPLVGFQAKLVVLLALLSTGQVGLAVFAALISVVGAFYYIRVVKVMYFDEPASTAPLQAPLDMRAVLSVNGLLLLLLGIFPTTLLTLCVQAVVHMLST